jgi:hypothetical protein
VEAMVSVGMDKQRRYEEGYQRIQSQIDQVAGMSVLRPVDKQYMQSKLNELGNNLKGVAAADFSNFQLVNSVGGMVGQIAKDKRIQSAVYSTKKAQDEIAKAQKLYDEGKSSINNLNDIKDQVSEYAMSIDPNSQFNGRYVNYIDLNKKYQDLADNLKKSAPSIAKDNPYKTDAAGNTLYYKKVSVKDESGKTVTKLEASTNPNSGGAPELDDAMKRITIKGVSAQDMYDAMKNSLTEDDLAQMRIDAKAEYRGKGPESILALYSEANNLATASMKDGIGKLKVLLTNPKLTSAEREEVEARIGGLESKLSRNNSEYENGMRTLAVSLSNPATLKNAQFEVYKKAKLNQTAISLSNRSYEEELKSNPYEEANHRRLVLQNQIINANRDYNLRAAQFAETQTQNTFERNKWEEEKKIKALAQQGVSPVVRDKAISTDVNKSSIDEVNTDLTVIGETLNTLDTKYGKLLNMSKTALDEQYNKYLKDPMSTAKMTNNTADYVNLRFNQEKLRFEKNNIKQSAEKVNASYEAKIDATLGSMQGILGNDGKELITAKDLYKVRQIVTDNLKVSAVGGVAPLEVYSSAFNEAAILKNIGNNPQKLAIAKAIIKNVKREQLTPTEQVIVDRAFDLTKKLIPSIEKIVRDGREAVSKEIMKYDLKYQEQVATLRNENVNDMNEVRNVIGDMITKLNTGEPVSLPSGKKISVESLEKIQKEIGKGATVAIAKASDGSAVLDVQFGSETQTIPLSATEFSQRFSNYAKTNPFTASLRALNSNPFKTTNIGGGAGDKSSDAVNAGFWGFQAKLLNGTDYANRVRFDIIGRDENSGDAENDRYALRIFVQRPNGRWAVEETVGGWQSIATVQNYINTGIGITTIEGILNRNK